jgi:hypothetical protein
MARGIRPDAPDEPKDGKTTGQIRFESNVLTTTAAKLEITKSRRRRSRGRDVPAGRSRFAFSGREALGQDRRSPEHPGGDRGLPAHSGVRGPAHNLRSVRAVMQQQAA